MLKKIKTEIDKKKIILGVTRFKVGYERGR
jgi:hypothetical protein